MNKVYALLTSASEFEEYITVVSRVHYTNSISSIVNTILAPQSTDTR